jgi:ketosteroid isomerase-like protein
MMADASVRDDPADPAVVARRYLAAFATADPAQIAGYVTEDFVNEHTSALGGGCVGRAAYLERLPGFLASMAGVRYDVEDVIADGERVAAAYTMHATNDGHPITIRGVMWMHVRDGLVAKRTDYWDSLTFLRQTGKA